MLVINFHEPQSYGSIFRKKGRGLPNAYNYSYHLADGTKVREGYRGIEEI